MVSSHQRGLSNSLSPPTSFIQTAALHQLVSSLSLSVCVCVCVENGNTKQISAAQSVQWTQSFIPELNVDLKSRSPAVETSAQTPELLIQTPHAGSSHHRYSGFITDRLIMWLIDLLVLQPAGRLGKMPSSSVISTVFLLQVPAVCHSGVTPVENWGQTMWERKSRCVAGSSTSGIILWLLFAHWGGTNSYIKHVKYESVQPCQQLCQTDTAALWAQC